MNEKGGISLADKHFNGIYEEMASLIGYEAVIKIYTAYKGQQLNLPSRLFSPEYVKQQIINNCHDSAAIKSMAVKYGYTERWIRSTLKKYIEKENKKK